MSGTPINTPFFVMGMGGISSVAPGNLTGVPSLGAAGPTSTASSLVVTINVGSGAEDASALNIQPVTRNTIANDRLNPAPIIGGQPSGDTSPILPPGQSYRDTTATTTPNTAAGATTTIPTSTSPPLSGDTSNPNPQSPYPPSVVPLVFPFRPATGPMTTTPGAPAGSFPGGPVLPQVGPQTGPY